jgi:hypothetical protein
MGNSERKSSAKSAPAKSSRTSTEPVDTGSGDAYIINLVYKKNIAESYLR